MSLSPENYEEGLRLCLENACRLLDDAEILLRNQSYGHALSLSILAMEEYAKNIMLMAVKSNSLEVDEKFWDMFRSHMLKLQLSTYMLFRSEDLSEEVIKERVEFLTRLDSIKQRGFYVDYIKNKWVSPFSNDLIEAAKQTLAFAKHFIEEMERYFFVFERKV